MVQSAVVHCSMTVACPLGEFELISKSEDVVRVILNAESNKDWTSWTDGFRLLRTYFFNKFRDYNPAADFVSNTSTAH